MMCVGLLFCCKARKEPMMLRDTIRTLLMALFQTLAIGIIVAIPCILPIVMMHEAMVDVSPYITYYGLGLLGLWIVLSIIGIVSDRI